MRYDRCRQCYIKSAKSYRERHNIDIVFNNIDKIRNNKDIDIIYVAPYPNFYVENMQKKSGSRKHVYVEKLLVLGYADGLLLKEVIEETSKKAFTVFYRRGLDYFKRL